MCCCYSFLYAFSRFFWCRSPIFAEVLAAAGWVPRCPQLQRRLIFEVKIPLRTGALGPRASPRPRPAPPARSPRGGGRARFARARPRGGAARAAARARAAPGAPSGQCAGRGVREATVMAVTTVTGRSRRAPRATAREAVRGSPGRPRWAPGVAGPRPAEGEGAAARRGAGGRGAAGWGAPVPGDGRAALWRRRGIRRWGGAAAPERRQRRRETWEEGEPGCRWGGAEPAITRHKEALGKRPWPCQSHYVCPQPFREVSFLLLFYFLYFLIPPECVFCRSGLAESCYQR